MSWCGAVRAGSAPWRSRSAGRRGRTPSPSSLAPRREQYCLNLGAKAYINRKDFDCWGTLPDTQDTEAYRAYIKRVRRFGKAIWNITGGVDVDIVFEHPGEQTFPVSCYVVRRGGMVVFCAGTTGYNITFDARYVWMRQKRIQGSHFASKYEADEANHLVMDHRVSSGTVDGRSRCSRRRRRTS